MEIKKGDIIRFHSWGIGGFLFGIVKEINGVLYACRPNATYDIKDIDTIQIVNDIGDIKEYQIKEYNEIVEYKNSDLN